MFDFRYHALSLVAVFLALMIGLLLGVAIGGPGPGVERRAQRARLAAQGRAPGQRALGRPCAES
jgi:hypothetical protein